MYLQCTETNKLTTPSLEALDNLKAALQVDVDPDQPFVVITKGNLWYYPVLDVDSIQTEGYCIMDTVLQKEGYCLVDTVLTLTQ